MVPSFSASDPVFQCYAFWAAVVSLKMLIIAPLTAFYRIKNKTPASPEDAKIMGYKGGKPGGRTAIVSDPDVDRVRRIHQNDLENIPVFLVLGFIFIFTAPTLFTAKICYAGFAIARIGHTLSYLSGITLTRGLGFFVNIGICGYMAVQIIMNFL